MSLRRIFCRRRRQKTFYTTSDSLDGGCVKSLFTALRAKLYLDRDIFFLILRSKIRKKMSLSKEYFAVAGGENLFTQPPSKDNLMAHSAIKGLFTQLRQIKSFAAKPRMPLANRYMLIAFVLDQCGVQVNFCLRNGEYFVFSCLEALQD